MGTLSSMMETFMMLMPPYLGSWTKTLLRSLGSLRRLAPGCLTGWLYLSRGIFNLSFRILDEERDVLVFFYEDEDAKSLGGVIKSLEVVDDALDAKDIEFVKISDEKVEVEFAVDKLPTLVYFENKIPIEYDGKLLGEHVILIT